MKRKFFLGGAALLFTIATIFNMNLLQPNNVGDISLAAIAVTAQASGEVTCDGGFCVVMGYKNRFLARGCKIEPSYACTVQKVDIGIGL